MKKIFFLSAFTLMVFQAFSQWVSPSESQSFTLSFLCQTVPQVVENNGGNYTIRQNITISPTDTLSLIGSDSSVVICPGVTIEIRGTLATEERTMPLRIIGQTDGEYFEIKFDSSSGSVMKKVDVENCKRILLINSDVLFSECEFHGFSNHVISYMNCSPTIEYCYFHDNEACAIQSAVNTEGSPKILYNRMYNNVLSNSNNPQINIGPSANDTIQIIGNTIEGLNSNMSGGIGISNMFNPDITLLVLKNNIIKNNRYGFTQNGYRISSLITENQFLYNNLETNPNNGGSGISIFGYDSTCSSKIRGNLIAGNLWGITAIYYNDVNLGTDDDHGLNVIYDNMNNATEYALFNNSNSAIKAVGNYWGYESAEDVENVIYHYADSNIYGLVNYLPINVITPEIVSFSFLKEDNPSISSNAYGEFSATGDTIFVQVCSNEGLQSKVLKPSISMPYGISVSPYSEEGVNFENPVVYTAYTPHQTSREYVVMVDFNTLGMENFTNDGIRVYPNPIVDGFFNINNVNNKSYRCEIISLEGKIVKGGIVKPGVNRMRVSGLNPGLYFLKMHNNNEVFERTIIIK